MIDIRLFSGVLLSVVTLLSGCDVSKDDTAAAPTPGKPSSRTGAITPVTHRPRVPPHVLEIGRTVYQKHCAACHGDKAQGNPQWRIKPANGMWLPPPLNGSGHTWHHPRKWLVAFIKKGSPPGKGMMPGWQGKLSDQEIEAVIYWFQSLWPDKAYFLWRQRDKQP